jgi:hypothetical protein
MRRNWFDFTTLRHLHQTTFRSPNRALSFNLKVSANNSIKLIETKENLFLLSEEHFFAAVLVYKKIYAVEFEELSHEVLEFFS